MASYVSIKGWIECSDDDIKIIQETLIIFGIIVPSISKRKNLQKYIKAGGFSRQIVLIGAAIFFLVHA